MRRAISSFSAVLAVLAGAVLAGGRVASGPPSVSWFVAAAVGAVLLGYLGRREQLHGSRLLAATVPAGVVIVAMYASDGVTHFLGVTSDLGMLLAVGHAALVVYLQHPPMAQRFLTTGALGGLTGAACASLLGLVLFGGSAGAWALGLGWATGIAVGGFLGVPSRGNEPREPRRVPLSALPLLGAWIMAVIASFPAAPRHELATSAGAQVLGGLLALMLVGVSVALALAERREPGASALEAIRLAARMNVRAVTPLSLLLIGALQAASYSAVTMDDLVHFWLVADSLAWEGTYLFFSDRTDLPVFPMMLLISFGLFGHTYPAALAPLFVANLFLPLAIFGAARAFEVSRTVAYVVAVLSVVFPLIQVYSLGAVEPDPIFILLLAISILVVGRVVKSPERRGWALLLGLLAGLVATTRPEGPLYAACFLLGAVIATRRAVTGLAVVSAVALVAPFVIYVYNGLGRPWPTASQSFSLVNLSENAGVIGSTTWGSAARVVLMDDIRFAVLISAILMLFGLGAATLTNHYPGLVLIPTGAVVNVVVTMGLGEQTFRPGELSEFVRHIAYPMPIVAVMVALGLVSASRFLRLGMNARLIASSISVAAAVYLGAGSLYLLGTPEEYFHGNNTGSLLTSQTYVNVPELWKTPFELPCLVCPESDDWDFMEFRASLFEAYLPFDSHSDSAGTSYQTLTAALAAAGLAVSLLAGGSDSGLLSRSGVVRPPRRRLQ